MYILRKRYGLLGREVTTPQIQLWIRKTVRLMRNGYPPNLAGDISAKQVFRTYGHESVITDIEVEEILDLAQTHFAEQLESIDLSMDPEDGGGSDEKGRPVVIGSGDRSWPGRLYRDEDRYLIDSSAPIEEGDHVALAYGPDDSARVTAKLAVVKRLVDATDETDDNASSKRRFDVLLRETLDFVSSSSSGD